MNSTSYWSRNRVLARRRLMQGTAAAGAGVASLALVGCGDDDDDATPSGGNTPAPGGTTATGSPTAKATEAVKKGGMLTRAITVFPATFDIYSTSETNARNFGGQVYSKIIEPKGVPSGSPDFPSQEVVPDLATSWETPDKGLTFTFKINPKAKWHAPLSRPLTADDIVFSVNRFLGKTSAKAAVNREQLSMVESVSAPDKQTVVFKLDKPNALFLLRLADDYVLPILPPEIESTVDVTQTAVGSGPWIVDKITRPSGYTLKRNPEWHLGPDMPYLDGQEFIVIGDPATSLTQFKAGNLDLAPNISLKDIPGVRSSIKDLVVSVGSSGTAMPYTAFSAVDPNSPWIKDPRVRQAFSMTLDRNALWAAFYPDSEYKTAGVEVPKVKWHNMVPVGLGPEWVDPQGSEMKASNKEFFVYDPAKAKALLSAAGFPDGIESEWHYTTGYGAQFTTHGELAQQMIGKGGFNLTTKLDDMSTVFIPKTFLKGEFEGFAQIYQGYGTALEWFNGMYLPGSSRNQGRINDPALTAKIEKLNATLDIKERSSQTVDIVNYIVEKMYYVPGELGAAPAVGVRLANVHGTADHTTARSGGGFYAAYYWKG